MCLCVFARARTVCQKHIRYATTAGCRPARCCTPLVRHPPTHLPRAVHPGHGGDAAGAVVGTGVRVGALQYLWAEGAAAPVAVVLGGGAGVLVGCWVLGGVGCWVGWGWVGLGLGWGRGVGWGGVGCGVGWRGRGLARGWVRTPAPTQLPRQTLLHVPSNLHQMGKHTAIDQLAVSCYRTRVLTCSTMKPESARVLLGAHSACSGQASQVELAV